MADGLEVTTQGFPELDKVMDDLGNSLGEQICRKGLRAGGNVMKAAIAANAPVRPDLPSGTAIPVGALQSDITVTVSKDSEHSFSAWIEPGKLTLHVARWVEWGHQLVLGGRKNKGGKITKLNNGAEDVPAYPYIRPAFDSNEDLAFNAVAETIATEVNAVASEKGLNAGR